MRGLAGGWQRLAAVTLAMALATAVRADPTTNTGAGTTAGTTAGTIASTTAGTQAPAHDGARVEAGFQPCPDAPNVWVRAEAAGDARNACEGAARSLVFLAGVGLPPPPRTVIDIVQQLPGELGGRAVGCWFRDTQRIQLLSYAAFEAGGEWFRTPVDRELYRAVASHETAHAVAGCHAEPRRLPVAAHEYLAYVAMFATLDPALRERMLARFAGTGFSNSLQINDILYLFDPNQFAVDAWRHYLRRPDRAAWLRAVASGQVVPEWPNDGP